MGYTGKKDTSGHMTPMEYAPGDHVVLGGPCWSVLVCMSTSPRETPNLQLKPKITNICPRRGRLYMDGWKPRTLLWGFWEMTGKTNSPDIYWNDPILTIRWRWSENTKCHAVAQHCTDWIWTGHNLCIQTDNLNKLAWNIEKLNYLSPQQKFQ